jgi:hypothetical protein
VVVVVVVVVAAVLKGERAEARLAESGSGRKKVAETRLGERKEVEGSVRMSVATTSGLTTSSTSRSGGRSR